MTTGIILSIIAFIFFALWLREVSKNYKLQKLCDDYRAINETWDIEFSKINRVSHNYKNACRLVGIFRSGRVLTFKMIRDEDAFDISVMSMMADKTDEWRQRAGV